MRITPSAVGLAFCTLEAAGFAAPKSYATAAGLDQGVKVYTAVLDELTSAELGVALTGWLRGSSPFWPKPGELLGLVDLVDESIGRFGESPARLVDRQAWRARRRARAKILSETPRDAIRFEALDPSDWRSRRRRVLPLEAQRRLEALDTDEEER